MMAAPPELEAAAPPTASDLKASATADQVRLVWKGEEAATPGTWIVGYRVYRDGELIGTAYGLQFFDQRNDVGKCAYEVRSMSASGVLSDPVRIEVGS